MLCLFLLYTEVNQLCVHAEWLQWYPTLCNPMDCSPPSSSVYGILHARILVWVAMPASRDLPNLGTKHPSLMSPALAGRFFIISATWKVEISSMNTCIPCLLDLAPSAP